MNTDLLICLLSLGAITVFLIFMIGIIWKGKIILGSATFYIVNSTLKSWIVFGDSKIDGSCNVFSNCKTKDIKIYGDHNLITGCQGYTYTQKPEFIVENNKEMK